MNKVIIDKLVNVSNLVSYKPWLVEHFASLSETAQLRTATILSNYSQLVSICEIDPEKLEKYIEKVNRFANVKIISFDTLDNFTGTMHIKYQYQDIAYCKTNEYDEKDYKYYRDIDYTCEHIKPQVHETEEYNFYFIDSNTGYKLDILYNNVENED